MLTITIDNKEVSVPEDSRVIDAATSLGIDIPTLCYLKSCEIFTSCMVCVAKDTATGKLIPACSTPVTDGMVIESNSEEVSQARKEALELLLSEHVGDCEAQCRIICPAYMNIPRMIRDIRDARPGDAVRTVRRHIPLPATISRICPAPCEKGCRRGRIDEAVAIRDLVRNAADTALASGAPAMPEVQSATGKKVAVIGSGPMGLSAAYYLLTHGHSCSIFEKSLKPGGMLREGVSRQQLPLEILEAEIDLIREMGAVFVTETEVGKDMPLEKLQADFDAVLLAPGELSEDSSLPSDTDMDMVFATDKKTGKVAAKAVAAGRTLAMTLTAALLKKEPVKDKRFNSRFGPLLDTDKAVFMQEAAETARVTPASGDAFSADEASAEASRCLHCDCRKPDTCKLRQYAEEYQAKASAYKAIERSAFSKNDGHPEVIYEEGKCIKCGLCVRISARYTDGPGLAFSGRGSETRIVVPFNDLLETGLKQAAEECVTSCPTGALAWIKD